MPHRNEVATATQPHDPTGLEPPVSVHFTDEAVDVAVPLVKNLEAAQQEEVQPSEVARIEDELVTVAREGIFGIEAEQVPDTEHEFDQVVDDMHLVEAIRMASQARIDASKDRLKKVSNRLQKGEGPKQELSAQTTEQYPVTLPSGVTPTKQEVVTRFERSIAVKDIPRLATQASDTTRKKKFEFQLKSARTGRRHDGVYAEGTKTEQEGLQELHDFLSDFNRAYGRSKSGKQRLLARQAKAMRENLTFVGEKEFNEAVAGLGTSWKAYLDEDPKRKICVLTEVGSLRRYEGLRKSDEYILDQILTTFSDEELEQYSGRIVNSIDDLGATQPADSRIILLDDWVISGRQMRDVYSHQMENEEFAAYAREGRVEINLLVSSRERLAKGLEIDPYNPRKGSIPVRAYFRSRHSRHANPRAKGHDAHVSGLHSSVNFDFKHPCKDMRVIMGRGVSEPSLTGIVRSYRHEKSQIVITRDTLKRVDKRAGAADNE